ncbi:MAG TPA: LuxR C-terminal-related transcriptional regulator [Rhizobacter sp.]|nr:LuxR C-terminal-related transcriptional regulator [Rhizobacter sp.]
MSILGAQSPAKAEDELLLHVIPPRVPRHLLARPRLRSDAELVKDQALVVLRGPAGFGKTTLLAQWRLEHLARGNCVAWVRAREDDHPRRFAQALALAVRTSAGRPGFCATLFATEGPSGLHAFTVWLSELAQAALNLVLIVDDADRLPSQSRAALVHVLRNAPPNLRIVIAGRADCQLDVDDLVDYGQCVILGPSVLRFRLEETLQLVRTRFGSRIDKDAAARVQELTEGWPLGLQLVLSPMSAGETGQEGAVVIARSGELQRHFAELLSRLDAADVAFLVRMAVIDQLCPALCCAVVGRTDAGERLTRLSRDTPIFVTGEHTEWTRMHAAARRIMRERFAVLPADERIRLHARAAAWFEQHDLLEDAARHALEAGRTDEAYDLAERTLYDDLIQRGRHATALDWLGRLPAAQIEQRPRLLLVAAWSLALSERHAESEALVERLLVQAGADEALRCECALIRSGAMMFGDQPDRLAHLFAHCAENPALTDRNLLQIRANQHAYLALLEGQPALARLRQQDGGRIPLAEAGSHMDHWGLYIVALSYLWEGQALLAQRLLQPALASVESELGRRDEFACMLAALLASALWERDCGEEAAAVLADRMDRLEHIGLPEALLLAYRTLARIAIGEGAEHRAIELLDAMLAVGQSRDLPRLQIASLADQVRLHARRYRAQTCRELCARIDALAAAPDRAEDSLWHRTVDPLVLQARAYAAIAARDWAAALPLLRQTDGIAQRFKMGRLHIETLGLQALAMDHCGQPAQPLLREAIDLARAYGLTRVLLDAHPELAAMTSEALAAEGALEPAYSPAPPAVSSPRPLVANAVPPSADPHGKSVLTAKEREVLALLAHNLSNKEIGRAMQAGETTVKWHVKNLFAKLDAGSRREVVSRARIFGLLPPQT